MVWGAFTGHGNRVIYKWPGVKIDSKKYVRMLSNVLLPVWNEAQEMEMDSKFYQDNAPSHRSAHKLNYLRRKNIPVLRAPPYSPDLIPMENVWELLVRRVYANGRVYLTTNDLWSSIRITQWDTWWGTKKLGYLFKFLSRSCTPFKRRLDQVLPELSLIFNRIKRLDYYLRNRN